MRTKPIEVLLVEDNPGDVRLMQEALKDSKLPINLRVVEDGVEAMAFLRRQGAYANVAQPDMVLLDLGLPRKPGMEVLKEIKSDPALKRTPVVILSASQAERDIVESYNQFANCYVIKPVGLEQFISVVKTIEDFWLTVVKLPRE